MLGTEFTIGAADACHRLVARKGGVPGIIVRFVRRYDAERILNAPMKKRGKITLRHLGKASDSRIIVNLSLCKSRRVHLGMAKKSS